MPDTTLEQQLIDLLGDRDLTRVSIDAGVDHRGNVHFHAYAHGGALVGASGACGSVHGAVEQAVGALAEKRFAGEVRPLAAISAAAAPAERAA